MRDQRHSSAPWIASWVPAGAGGGQERTPVSFLFLPFFSFFVPGTSALHAAAPPGRQAAASAGAAACTHLPPCRCARPLCTGTAAPPPSCLAASAGWRRRSCTADTAGQRAEGLAKRKKLVPAVAGRQRGTQTGFGAVRMCLACTAQPHCCAAGCVPRDSSAAAAAEPLSARPRQPPALMLQAPLWLMSSQYSTTTSWSSPVPRIRQYR